MTNNISFKQLIKPCFDIARKGSTFCATKFGVHLRVCRSLDLHQYGSVDLNLSYHWRDEWGGVVVWDGLRTAWPAVHIGDCVDVDLLVQAPDCPGEYILEITAVLEGLHWFEDIGIPPLKQCFDVQVFTGNRHYILVAGGSGFENCGDEALLRSAVEICRRSAPNASIVLSANNPRVAIHTLRGLPVSMVSSLRISVFRSDDHYNTADNVFFERRRIVENIVCGSAKNCHEVDFLNCPELSFVDCQEFKLLIQALQSADALVVHGGGVLTSSTRSRLWEMALLVQFASSYKIPVAVRSHQFGPYTDADDAVAARCLLDHVGYASTRDIGESIHCVRELGTHSVVWESVDDAFHLDYLKINAGEFSSKYGLEPGGYICCCYRRNPSVGVTDAAMDLFIQTIEQAATLSGKPIVLLPMGPFDLDVLREVAGRLKQQSSIVEPDDWFTGPPAVAQHAYFVVSLPHHPLIFALQGGTPVISLVEGDYYCAKNRGSMRWFGLEGFVVDVCAPNAPKILRLCLKMMTRRKNWMRGYISTQVKILEERQLNSQVAFDTFIQGAIAENPRITI